MKSISVPWSDIFTVESVFVCWEAQVGSFNLDIV